MKLRFLFKPFVLNMKKFRKTYIVNVRLTLRPTFSILKAQSFSRQGFLCQNDISKQSILFQDFQGLLHDPISDTQKIGFKNLPFVLKNDYQYLYPISFFLFTFIVKNKIP